MAEIAEHGPRRPARQDTFDLRQDMIPESEQDESFVDNEYEDVMDYDSGGEEHHRSMIEEDDEDDDSSSQLSIPNETIDFDLVYSLRNFVATTEGQANVHKGDTLFLMDDSNSYWWLVRVLKTSDIGYIPAENIETPIERLARLNKHRNVDLASATPAEQESDTEHPHISRGPSRNGSKLVGGDRRSVIFTGSSVYYYPPFVWGNPGQPLEDPPEGASEGEDEGDYAAYEGGEYGDDQNAILQGMEPDDGMSWDEDAADPRIITSNHLATSEAIETITNPLIASPIELSQRIAQQSAVGLGLPSGLQKQSSKENLNPSSSSSLSVREYIDPAEVTETRKLSVTPTIAREGHFANQQAGYDSSLHPQRALSISSTASGASSSESGGMKRGRDDTDDGGSQRGKVKPGDRKLRKDRTPSESGDLSDRGQSSDGGKKKVGFLGGLFGRKKEKKEARIGGSTDADSITRSSGESAQTGSVDTHLDNRSDNSSMRMAQKPQYGSEEVMSHEHRYQPGGTPGTTLNASSFASSSDPSQSESIQSSISNTSSSTLQPPTARPPRPGSLILSSSTTDGLSAIVPELSVLRVFAGDHLQSEATFKTVLINASTTTVGLVRQAMQRFRLPEGEDPNDYYLTIKQVDGDEARLHPEEHPLQAFEQLAEQVNHIQSIKRSSMGSINSLASNLTMSIAKLGMNDFTDDSTVKLYLHRQLKGGDDELTPRESYDSSYSPVPSEHKGSQLTVSTANATLASVSPERFSSPSARFAMQVYIYPEDLPDGMVFDPHTEAIVPRSTLQHRSGSSATISPGVSQTQRRKVFVFPKNTTVAEVIEASLERFGIVEGVVEGGDDVEDKPAKRRSTSRVRYGLNVLYSDGQQRELQPSTKVLDAFAKPPLFKTVDRRSSEWRRRSMESAHLMGTNDDIQQDDPGFVLRRAVGTRSGGKPKAAGPLDELALRQLHRESMSSDHSQPSSVSSQQTQKGVSRSQETLTIRPNRDQGVDIMVDAGLFRSHRQGNNPPSYTFVNRSGEAVDIRDFVVDEFGAPIGYQRNSMKDLLDQATMSSTTALTSSLLRILERIRTTSPVTQTSTPRANVTSPSIYSQTSRSGAVSPSQKQDNQSSDDDGRSRSATPTAARASAASPISGPIASRATAPTSSRAPSPASTPQILPGHRSQPSIASVMSDFSAYTSESESNGPRSASLQGSDSLRSLRPTLGAGSTSMSPIKENTESGITRMLAIIELGAALGQPPRKPEPSLLDSTFLGTPVVLEELHPRAREIYEPTLKELEDASKRLDQLLHLSQSLGRV